jgi:hypothetical protein
MMHIEKDDSELRAAIKRIVVDSRNEKDLVNRVEALVIQEVQAAIEKAKDDTVELRFPDYGVRDE